MRFVNRRDVPTFKIELPPTEENPGPDWVESKIGLRLSERGKVNSGLIQTREDEEGEMKPYIDTSRSNTLRLLAYLVAWGGPGFTKEDGTTMPLTEESIDDLDEPTADFILKAIRARNPRPVAPKG